MFGKQSEYSKFELKWEIVSVKFAADYSEFEEQTIGILSVENRLLLIR